MAHEVRPRHLSINDVEGVLEEMHSEKDPLAVHILVSRRSYRNVRDTKSGKKRETFARRSWRSARELGFRGNLGEWERLKGAAFRPPPPSAGPSAGPRASATESGVVDATATSRVVD